VGSCRGTGRGGGEGGDRFIPCAYKQKRYIGWERGRRKIAKGGQVQETLRREYGTSKDALFQNNTKPQQFPGLYDRVLSKCSDAHIYLDHRTLLSVSEVAVCIRVLRDLRACQRWKGRDDAKSE